NITMKQTNINSFFKLGSTAAQSAASTVDVVPPSPPAAQQQQQQQQKRLARRSFLSNPRPSSASSSASSVASAVSFDKPPNAKASNVARTIFGRKRPPKGLNYRPDAPDLPPAKRAFLYGEEQQKQQQQKLTAEPIVVLSDSSNSSGACSPNEKSPDCAVGRAAKIGKENSDAGAAAELEAEADCWLPAEWRHRPEWIRGQVRSVKRLSDELELDCAGLEPCGWNFVCRLCDSWSETRLNTGDTVQIVLSPETPWQPDHPELSVTDQQNYFVLLPDQLLSATAVVASLGCVRRSVLDSMYTSLEGENKVMLLGSVVHQLFQDLLVRHQTAPVTEASASAAAAQLVNSGQLVQQLAALGLSESELLAEVSQFVKHIVDWLRRHHDDDGSDGLRVNGVADIEESVGSRRFGLKGKVDVSLLVADAAGGDKRLPVELKTGRASFSHEHVGQALLYSMMLDGPEAENSSTADGADGALLLYLRDGPQQQLFRPDRSRRCGLLQLRNELAGWLARPPVIVDEGDGGSTEACEVRLAPLPDPLTGRDRWCAACPQLLSCSLLHRLAKGEAGCSFGGRPSAEKAMRHLSERHAAYFGHWSRLLLMERQAGQAEAEATSAAAAASATLLFEGQRPAGGRDGGSGQQTLVRFRVAGTDEPPLTDVASEGDFAVVDSADGCLVGLCAGLVREMACDRLALLCDRPLKKTDLHYRIRKSNSQKSIGICLSYLVMLMEDSPISTRLRELLIDKRPPEVTSFDHATVVSVRQFAVPLNREQRKCLLATLAAKDFVLLKGYPGTGKTTFLAALVAALVHLGARVLVSAYTHSAVDNILVKIADTYPQVGLLRIGQEARVHPRIRSRCLASELQSLQQQQREGSSGATSAGVRALVESRPVFGCTCLGALDPCLARCQFDFALIDEAGQAPLPACLGPLLRLSGSGGRFLLVGDPHQLPPMVLSRRAASLGLGRSLLCRLLNREAVTARVTFALTEQYRMNSYLLQLPNQLLYNGELTAHESVSQLTLPAVTLPPRLRDPLACLAAVWSDRLEHSLVFVSTERIDSVQAESCGRRSSLAGQASGSSSLANPLEASLAVSLLRLLCPAAAAPADVGLMSPYRDQVALLRRRLSAESGSQLTGVEASTIDQFQGRDKSLILLSMARREAGAASASSILSDPRRFNVAVTRAKRKLIVIGHAAGLGGLPTIDALLKLLPAECMVRLTDREFDVLTAAEMTEC
ncbi:hypothetical protein BOX15_Mlig016069g1, partial [Macrostomum lignano]